MREEYLNDAPGVYYKREDLEMILFFYNEKCKRIFFNTERELYPYSPYLYSKKSWIVLTSAIGIISYDEDLKELKSINEKELSKYRISFSKLLNDKIVLSTYEDINPQKRVAIYKSLFSISLKDFSLNVIKESFKKKISTKNLIFDISEDLKHLLILKNKREIYLFDIKSEDMKLLYKSQKDIRRVEFVR
jgi:hypothetical protein